MPTSRHERDARVRHRTVKLRADTQDDTTFVRARAVAWDSRNSYGEIFVPGAFSDDLAAHDDDHTIVMGLYHDRAIGLWSDYTESTEGLDLGGPISDTADGRDAATLVRDGALTGVSVGFFDDVVQLAHPGERVSFDTPFGTRSYEVDEFTWFIVKARVVEASLVMAPADNDARVLEVRAAENATRALPAVRKDEPTWEETAYSMALLMGGRGAGSFSDLPAPERRALYARLAGQYAAHDRTAPDFTPDPVYDEVTFHHEERQVFHDLHLRKRLADLTASARAQIGPISEETRAIAREATEALAPLCEETENPLAAIRDQLDQTNRLLKEINHA